MNCTYKAAADVMGVHERTVRNYLGDRRAQASWVVEKSTGHPKGYSDHNKHPELYRTSYVIATGEELLRCKRRNITEFPE